MDSPEAGTQLEQVELAIGQALERGLTTPSRLRAIYLDKRSDTELYGRVFDRLTVDAHTPDLTRPLLAKVRAEL